MSFPRFAILLFGLAPLFGERPAAAAPSRDPREFAVDRLPAELSGTWEIAFDDGRWRPVTIPGTWQDSGLPNHGFAWLRVRFRVSPGASEQALAFASTQIRDAEEVFL